MAPSRISSWPTSRITWSTSTAQKSDLKPLDVRRLGIVPYGEALEMQKALVEERRAGRVPDTLLLLQHPPVITLGVRRSSRTNVVATDERLAELGVEIVETGRGGDVTYHGPGQLVGYPIFLLRQEERDLHVYLRNLEEAIIRACARFGLPGERKEGWTGVWTAGGARKLASIGVAVKRWVTMHGFALNVSTDLARFAAINPCGLDAAVMTSVSACLQRAITVDELKSIVAQQTAEVFDRQYLR
jgi:lipoate-protein ligase B